MSLRPPLTRDIGLAERALQALLRKTLGSARLTFAQWVVLTFLSNATQLDEAELVERLDGGKIADPAEARLLIAGMKDAGLLASTGVHLCLSDRGATVYHPLQQAVRRMTEEIFASLPAGDLEATRRTLAVVTQRAQKLLLAGEAQSD